MLADAAPGEGGRAGVVDVVVACGGGHAVKADLLGDLELAGVFAHVRPAHQLGDLGKGAVAGHGQRPLQVAGAVGSLAGDGLLAIGVLAVAGKGAALNVRHAVQSGGTGNDLENGAGGIGRLEEAVEIHARIGPGGVPLDVGHIVRVVGGGRNGAEDLPRFVIINRHGALAPIHGAQRRVLYPGGQSQILHAPLVDAVVDAVDQVKPGQSAGVFGHRPGADGAAAVAHPMQGGLAGLRV